MFATQHEHETFYGVPGPYLPSAIAIAAASLRREPGGPFEEMRHELQALGYRNGFLASQVACWTR
jgi:hypothetical protein